MLSMLCFSRFILTFGLSILLLGESNALFLQRRANASLAEEPNTTLGGPLVPRDRPLLHVVPQGKQGGMEAGLIGHALFWTINSIWASPVSPAPMMATWKDSSTPLSPISVTYWSATEAKYSSNLIAWACDELLALLATMYGNAIWPLAVSKVESGARGGGLIGYLSIKSESFGSANGVQENANSTTANDSPNLITNRETNNTSLDPAASQTIGGGDNAAQPILNTKIQYRNAELSQASLLTLLQAYFRGEVWGHEANERLSVSVTEGSGIQVGPDPRVPNAPKMIVQYSKLSTSFPGSPTVTYEPTWRWVVDVLLEALAEVVKDNRQQSFVMETTLNKPGRLGPPGLWLRVYVLAKGELPDLDGPLTVLPPLNSTVSGAGQVTGTTTGGVLSMESAVEIF